MTIVKIELDDTKAVIKEVFGDNAVDTLSDIMGYTEKIGNPNLPVQLTQTIERPKMEEGDGGVEVKDADGNTVMESVEELIPYTDEQLFIDNPTTRAQHIALRITDKAVVPYIVNLLRDRKKAELTKIAQTEDKATEDALKGCITT